MMPYCSAPKSTTYPIATTSSPPPRRNARPQSERSDRRAAVGEPGRSPVAVDIRASTGRTLRHHTERRRVDGIPLIAGRTGFEPAGQTPGRTHRGGIFRHVPGYWCRCNSRFSGYPRYGAAATYRIRRTRAPDSCSGHQNRMTTDTDDAPDDEQDAA